LIGGADEIGKSAVAEIERSGGELLRGSASGDDHVEIDAVFLEPAEFDGDVFGPLQRTVADNPFDDLRLSLSVAIADQRHRKGAQQDRGPDRQPPHKYHWSHASLSHCRDVDRYRGLSF